MTHSTLTSMFVATTVIPLLYIALTLQGSTYQDYLSQVKATFEGAQDVTSWRGLISGLLKWSALYYAALTIWAAGILGEFTAIAALNCELPVWLMNY